MTFHFLQVQGLPIFDQLQLEEALVRADNRNWCLINQGSSRAIVMGISGKPAELLDLDKVELDEIPVIKRFSGGGTVIVDENTLFVTFICQKEIHSFSAYPEPIMKWSEEIYKSVFPQEHFSLRENDYVFGEKKFGGNAQYIKKDRWLHHTSFLWDYRKENMEYLLHPKKTPSYRQERSHLDFLCTLREHFEEVDQVILGIKQALEMRYEVKQVSLEEARSVLEKESRQATQFVEIKDRRMGPAWAAKT